MGTETPALTLVEKLRDVSCDRQPFTDEHKFCICRLASKAADEIERLSRELLEAKEALKPAHIYDPENWEYTMPLEDRASLVEDYDIVPGELKRFATLAPGPDMWAANVVLDRDDDGYPSECEIRWFNSEADARSVLSPKKDSETEVSRERETG